MNQILQALAALGTTPEEVYTNLKAQGIKGIRRSTCLCPIANYLSKVVGQPCSIGVSIAGKCGDGDKVIAPLPVQQFIIDFDGGLFSDLLDRI